MQGAPYIHGKEKVQWSYGASYIHGIKTVLWIHGASYIHGMETVLLTHTVLHTCYIYSDRLLLHKEARQWTLAFRDEPGSCSNWLTTFKTSLDDN